MTALAQGGGTVTVAPLSAGVPALGWPALGALAIALAVGAVVALRRSHQLGARVLGVVAVVLTAAVGHSAVSNVIISGDECHQVTEESYPAFDNVELLSQCPNPIRIIALQLDCNPTACEAPVASVTGVACEVGLNVPPGGSCELPACSC